MALRELRSDLSWYGKNPGPYKTPPSRNDTKFKGEDDVPYVFAGGYEFQGISLISPVQRFAGDSFTIDTGISSRGAQLGSGTKFPIGPAGQIHSFDQVRTGFAVTAKYGEVYSNQSKKGLANTYTLNSPIDDMYNKFNLRDDATPQLGYINHPLILRGIQRAGKSDPQRWGLGETAAGNLSSTFDIPRGGILTALERAAVDVVRVAKFVASPKGLSWGIKQFAFQLMGPNLEGEDGTTRKPLGKNSPKLWMPTSTLLQPLGVLAGMHMRRTGLLPLDIPLIEPHNYEDVLQFRLNKGKEYASNNNRLVKLKAELLPTPARNTAAILGDLQTHGLELNTPIKVLTAKSGPDSILGIGSTNINRFSNSSLKEQFGIEKAVTYFEYITRYNHYENPYLKTADSTGTVKTSGAMDENDADEANESLKSKYTIWPKISPDRGGDGEQLPGGGFATKTGGKKIDDYTRMAYGNIPRRIPSASPKNIDFRDIGSKDKTPVSKIWKEDTTIDTLDAHIDNSLIKFTFGTISFKAYIGSLNDVFAPSWSGQADQGRADSRYLYSGFERTISLDFLVPIMKTTDQKVIWKKLENLAQLTYPVYGTNGFYGQTVNVTIGDLFVNKHMIITDLGYAWDTDSPWEIDEGQQAPMYTTVSITFTVLGTKPTSTSDIYNSTLTT